MYICIYFVIKSYIHNVSLLCLHNMILQLIFFFVLRFSVCTFVLVSTSQARSNFEIAVSGKWEG